MQSTVEPKQKTTLSIVSYAAVCRVVDDSVDASQSLLYSRKCVVKVVEIACRKKENKAIAPN